MYLCVISSQFIKNRAGFTRHEAFGKALNAVLADKHPLDPAWFELGDSKFTVAEHANGYTYTITIAQERRPSVSLSSPKAQPVRRYSIHVEQTTSRGGTLHPMLDVDLCLVACPSRQDPTQFWHARMFLAWIKGLHGAFAFRGPAGSLYVNVSTGELLTAAPS